MVIIARHRARRHAHSASEETIKLSATKCSAKMFCGLRLRSRMLCGWEQCIVIIHATRAFHGDLMAKRRRKNLSVNHHTHTRGYRARANTRHIRKRNARAHDSQDQSIWRAHTHLTPRIPRVCRKNLNYTFTHTHSFAKSRADQNMGGESRRTARSPRSTARLASARTQVRRV